MSLPLDIAAALERLSDGVSRRELTERLGRISETYRSRGTSTGIADETDALAYALARMPATFGALSEALAQFVAQAPDWAPRTILDVGAGPGTATWAALERWPSAEAQLLDRNPAFLTLAEDLSQSADRTARTTRANIGQGDAGKADLVLAGYALTELADAELERVAGWLWAATEGVLVIAEPGTPRDYERLMRVRAALIGLGAAVIAPCPHERPCPLVPPDWCHFAVRVQRSRAHIALKSAELPYEDEKFSYLVVVRPGIGDPAAGRVIKPAYRSKFAVTLEVCGAEGLKTRTIAKRDKAPFRAARHLDWGDRIERVAPEDSAG